MWNPFTFKKKKRVIENYCSEITSKTVEAFNDDYKAYIGMASIYKLSPVEYLRYSAFKKEHEKCGHDTTGIMFYQGCGIGHIVHCFCRSCDTEADITDIDSW